MSEPDLLNMRTAPDGVTIAIPNWNHEYLLARSVGSALRSVRELRRHGVEADVLVVDDESRDGSLTLLRQFEALYHEDGLNVHALPRNGGLPALSRNELLRMARYRYTVFLDADNELIPENLWHFYRSIKATGAALVYGNLIGLDESDETIKIVSNESYQHKIMQGNYIDTLAMADRMQFSDVGGYIRLRELIAREDWELHMHLAAAGRRLIFVPIVLGWYYVLSGSMTDQTNDPQIHQQQGAWGKRVYNQLGLRARQPLNTRHLRYHPDVGYL